MGGREPTIRLRRRHRRRRTGCLTCKERHVRCDEMRPECTNCVTGPRACRYALFGEVAGNWGTKTKNLPGIAAPWQILGPHVHMLPGDTSADPFDTLPIEMPYQSRDLLSYFLHIEAPIAANAVLPAEGKDCLTLARSDSAACRSLMLIAGLHFSRSAGGLHAFEPTFLHHKLQCIRIVNMWLADPEERDKGRCMTLIVTLCVVEACLGNLAAAEYHLSGLMTLLQLRAERQSRGSEEEDNEILERYIFVAKSYIVEVGRLDRAFCQDQPSPKQGPAVDLRDRMDALRLMPYYFSVTADVKSRPADATPIISALRSLTAMSRRSGDKTVGRGRAWPPGGQSLMVLAFSRLHVASLWRSTDGQETETMANMPVSSWSSLAAATGFYLQCVLNLRKEGMPVELRQFSNMFCLLNEDLDSSLTALVCGKHNSDMWLWKAFCSAWSIANACTLYRLASSALVEIDNPQTLRHMRDVAYDNVRVWSRVTDVSEWGEALEALERIVWPEVFPYEEMQAVWNEAVKGDE